MDRSSEFERRIFKGLHKLTVSGSLSIFQKLCPSCASSQPVGAMTCDCGHAFETGASSGSIEETVLRDEELYENYLAARATQAEEASRVAREALAEDPNSPEKTAAAELAREVAESIRWDLADQQKKVATLRAKLAPVMAPREPLPQKPAPAERSESMISSVVEVRTNPPVTETTLVAVRAQLSQNTVSAAAPKVSLQPVSVSSKAAAALSALKNAKAREVTERKQKPAETPVVADTPPPVVTAASMSPTEPVRTPSVTNTPPPTFRAEQAAKAEKVMDTLQAANPHFKDCPNCTASVPVATTRCRCGFNFAPSGNNLPTLTLCTGDFTALRNSLNLNLRRGN
jgi:hypothetical protein